MSQIQPQTNAITLQGPFEQSTSSWDNDFNFARSIVDTRMSQAFDRADGIVSQANTAIASIAGGVDLLSLGSTPTLTLNGLLPTPPSLSYTMPTAPSLTQPAQPGDYVPGTVDLSLIPDLAALTAPAAPTLSMPQEPNVGTPTAPTKPVVDYSVSLPQAPTLSLPTAPTLGGVSVPNAPTITLPTPPSPVDVNIPAFVAPNVQPMDLNALDIAAPTGLPNIQGYNAQDVAALSIPIKDDLKEALATVITDFTTPNTVQTVTDQEVARTEDLIDRRANRQVDETWTEFASRGHIAPPGALAKRVDMIRDDADAEILAASRDVAMERMRSEVQTFLGRLQHGVQLAEAEMRTSIEAYQAALQTLSDAHRSHIEAYNAMVALFQARIQAANLKVDGFRANVELFNTRINEFNARIDVGRLEVAEHDSNAQTFDAQLRGALAPIQVYQSEVEAVRSKVQIQLGEVQLYEAQMRGEGQKIDLYRGQLEGSRTELDTKIAVLQGFQTEVEAFASEVRAVQSQYEGYNSLVQARLAPVQLYEAQMRGYTSEVEAERTKVDAGRAKVDAQLGQEQNKVRAYTANVQTFAEKIRAYQAQLQGEFDMIRAELQLDQNVQQGELDKYRAQVSAREADWQAQVAGFGGTVEAYRARANLLAEDARIQANATEGAAQISSSLASSALSAVNVGAQLGANAASGHNKSETDTTSRSYGESVALQHGTSNSSSWGEQYSYNFDNDVPGGA